MGIFEFGRERFDGQKCWQLGNEIGMKMCSTRTDTFMSAIGAIRQANWREILSDLQYGLKTRKSSFCNSLDIQCRILAQI